MVGVKTGDPFEIQEIGMSNLTGLDYNRLLISANLSGLFQLIATTFKSWY